MMNVPVGRMQLFEAGQPSDSVVTNSSSSADPALDFKGSYTFLRLGFVFASLYMQKVFVFIFSYLIFRNPFTCMIYIMQLDKYKGKLQVSPYILFLLFTG